MRSRTVTIRSVNEEDWREIRGLRLEMLQDLPLAYGETFEHASRQPEADWRLRGRRGEGPRTSSFVAIDDASLRWVGIMGGFIPTIGSPLLVGVYVAPDFRGREAGVADRLLEAVEGWARGFSDELRLEVHEDNPRAIRFYERHGFSDTGRRLTYELPPGGLEWEMSKRL
ncbi:MAG: hypothetical protein JWP75_2913 [Frondihabitans sp.]|nr:hypothetical protein [Frondihabitans sp.]